MRFISEEDGIVHPFRPCFSLLRSAVHAGHDKSTNIMHQKQYVPVCSTRTCSLRNLQALFCTAFKGALAGCLRLMMKPLCVLKSTVVVSVGDQHSLLVTVSGGRTPSQTATL